MAMTYPLLGFPELQDLCQSALGIQLVPGELMKPTTATLVKIISALLELISGVPRDEVAEAVQGQLDTMEHPEMYREALNQIVLCREIERLTGASLAEFRLEDLVQPSPARLQRMMSAVLNFGRFREDALRQHAVQTDALARVQAELNEHNVKVADLVQKIKLLRERQAKEAPERAEIESEIAKEESTLRALGAERTNLANGIEEDKKRLEQLRKKISTTTFDIVALKNEAEELRAQIVSSPERIQAELKDTRRRLAHEEEEVNEMAEHERALILKLEAAKAANRVADGVLTLLSDVQEVARKAQADEEEARECDRAVESHGYKLRELGLREQEAARASQLAEERLKSFMETRDARMDEARHAIQTATQALDTRERSQEESARRANTLRHEAGALRGELEAVKSANQEMELERQRIASDVVNALGSYLRGIEESSEEIKKAVSVIKAREAKVDASTRRAAGLVM